MTTLSPEPISIAIIGGGISGLLLAHALLTRSSFITITVYESATQFGEIGAGVGFEPHFVRIMNHISPKIREGFLRCCSNNGPETDPPKWFDVRIGDCTRADAEGVVHHRKDGRKVRLSEPLFVVPARKGERGGVHRAHFLDELVKLLPQDICQFRKRLVDVAEAADGSGDAVLHFADGTTAQHTAVIGCDGIKSRTRELVLGKKAARPVFSGKYAYRGLIPMHKAVEILGEEQPRTSQMYCGHKGHVLTFPIANGTVMNGMICTVVAFSSKDEWKEAEWVVKTSREDMLADYATWTPTVQAIMIHMKDPDIWALYDHLPARTFFQSRPRICLLGDAAHATTPHQGAGAGMCVEDCYILSELLAAVSSADGLEEAFRAYDEVRRPRSLKLVETSREAGMLWEMEGSHGNDMDAYERNACSRMNWIWDHDIDADLERARSLLRE
ncbi:FAD/NAD(P)-binding domain-containing protein [Lentithecium fluviatile CBS 122367]|uniref:FAD/NAD(P)-binding domain-containing protein n=1 Tax=Lentithecium fluviatile CBS 122367 TaxID=1168545 RepID=A0A6G1JKC3_9PLEO|nr:FAD/NAD(P)-binding domain-containing protein [Lentithecium fluviatile CBS 122367]